MTRTNHKDILAKINETFEGHVPLNHRCRCEIGPAISGATFPAHACMVHFLRMSSIPDSERLEPQTLIKPEKLQHNEYAWSGTWDFNGTLVAIVCAGSGPSRCDSLPFLRETASMAMGFNEDSQEEMFFRAFPHSMLMVTAGVTIEDLKKQISKVKYMRKSRLDDQGVCRFFGGLRQAKPAPGPWPNILREDGAEAYFWNGFAVCIDQSGNIHEKIS